MKPVNKFVINGVLGATKVKTTANGTELYETMITQEREWRGDVFKKTFPLTSFQEVGKTLSAIPAGTKVTVDGDVASRCWDKDPTRFFVNLTVKNVVTEDQSKAPAVETTEEDTVNIPF